MFGRIGEGVKILLIGIVGVFVLEWILRADWAITFGLVPALVRRGYVYQLITYQFIHGGFLHVIFNAMGLFFFGPPLEERWGTGRFLAFFLGCGAAGGVLTTLLAPNSIIPVIGCSGAVYGVLAASAILYPDSLIYLWMIVPVRAKWLILGMGLYEFVSLFYDHGSISHEAHLGGMIAGACFVLVTEKYFSYRIKRWYANRKYAREWNRREQEREKLNDLRKEVDGLLDKVNRTGLDSLSDQERRRLDEASRKLRGD